MLNLTSMLDPGWAGYWMETRDPDLGTENAQVCSFNAVFFCITLYSAFLKLFLHFDCSLPLTA